MSRKSRKGRKKQRQRGGRLTKEDKEKQLSDSMAKIHALFIKMEELFKGCTIAGVAIDSSSGAVCIHVEEHNKVLMFYANDFAIAEHAGKLADMLLAAGFLVPEPIMETWNQDFTDMVTAYSKAVMAGVDVDPEKVDAARIKLILTPFYSPEEAAAELEKVGKSEDGVAEAAATEDAPESEESEESEELTRYKALRGEFEEMPEDHEDRAKLGPDVTAAWEALTDEERAEFETLQEEAVEA